MFPRRTPVHVQNAHTSIVPIYEFLAKYERWIGEAGGACCDFALGNPQTMPLEGFVAALRHATTPRRTRCTVRSCTTARGSIARRRFTGTRS